MGSRFANKEHVLVDSSAARCQSTWKSLEHSDVESNKSTVGQLWELAPGSDLCPSHRIRKGFPCEARVVARILPQFLDDFFPPQDIMNKVIGEFLSNQQPYPQFMATVVYKVRWSACAVGLEWGSPEVQSPDFPADSPLGPSPSPLKGRCLWPQPQPHCPGTTSASHPHSLCSPPTARPDTQTPASFLQVFQTLHSTGQSSMVRDWVMLSLSNFTQRTPVAMATWSLSCFFVSASTSPWVAAMYPLWVPGAGPISLINTEACVS
ncbi:hypothetical protein P7K49_005938 [Saguinus oedipus]|uniref:Uncharacterized protein n=1 Tax=Saguinus oedipus TaxID=9490 RepID=A0ABQ9W4J3_SAGOE|nr:hypothetical protein P7K49_005938 [Saguinus oedipus]